MPASRGNVTFKKAERVKKAEGKAAGRLPHMGRDSTD
jgi:hypothetical protein